MSVTFTKEFWINMIIFLAACIALGISIWAFVVPCKKDGFGDLIKGCPTINLTGCSEYGKENPLENCNHTSVHLGNAKFCCR